MNCDQFPNHSHPERRIEFVFFHISYSLEDAQEVNFDGTVNLKQGVAAYFRRLERPDLSVVYLKWNWNGITDDG